MGSQAKYNSDKKKFTDTKYWLFRPTPTYCALKLKESEVRAGQFVPAKVCKTCDDLNTVARGVQHDFNATMHRMVSVEEDTIDEKGQEEESELSSQMKTFMKGTDHLDQCLKVEKELRNMKSSMKHWKTKALEARSEHTTDTVIIESLRDEITRLQEELDDSGTFSLKEGPHKSVSFHGIPFLKRFRV